MLSVSREGLTGAAARRECSYLRALEHQLEHKVRLLQVLCVVDEAAEDDLEDGDDGEHGRAEGDRAEVAREDAPRAREHHARAKEDCPSEGPSTLDQSESTAIVRG